MSYSQESIRSKNQLWIDALTKRAGADMEKEAKETAESYMRKQIMEDSVMTKIIPAETIGNEDLDVWLDTKFPMKIFELEPDATGAVSVQFGTQPDTNIMEGQRIPVYFNKLITDKYIKDTDELRVWKMDIRQIICDQQVKWLAFEVDRRYLCAVQQALMMQPTVIGKSLCKAYANGLTRDNYVDSLSLMLETRNHLRPTQFLCNERTMYEFFKWGRDEMGGDTAQEMLFSGEITRDFMGMKMIATIKHELIKPGYVYQFADWKYLGRNYILQPTTMFVETQATKISWFMYESRGGCIANCAAASLACFNPQGISNDGRNITFSAT